MSRPPSRYQRTSPSVTLTMNDGGVFRPRLSDGQFIQVARLTPVRFTNQDEDAYPPPPPRIKTLLPLPPRPVQAVEVLEVDV